jgi:hypothetical protein
MFLKKYFLKAVIFMSAFFTTSVVSAQEENVGTFQLLNADYYLTPKWNLWFEQQLRSDKFFDKFYYHEFKGGVNFKVQKDFAVLLGIGKYGTYSHGGNFKSPMTTGEFRLWEQFILTNQVSRIKLEHRYRIEQRFRTDGYRNRFRYRFNAIVPINKAKVENGTLYTTISNEIFLREKERFFERNRFIWAVGYQFAKQFTLQVGWARQLDYSGSGAKTTQDFLHTSFQLHFNQPDKKS